MLGPSIRVLNLTSITNSCQAIINLVFSIYVFVFYIVIFCFCKLKFVHGQHVRASSVAIFAQVITNCTSPISFQEAYEL